MKITIYSGCTNYGIIDVDGSDFESLSESTQKDLIQKALDFANPSNLREIFKSCLDHSILEPEYEDDGYCDQCNDYSSRTVYKL